MYLCALVLSIVIVTAKGYESRVYGGYESAPYNHKYLVQLHIMVWARGNNSGVKCSGSIIGPNHVITSAHCLPKGSKLVRILHSNPDGKGLETIGVVRSSGMISYPGYIHGDDSAGNYEKDLALLKTVKPMEFNKNVKPIKMSKSSPRHGQSAVMAGFGMREPELSAPREGMVNVLLSKSCEDIRGSNLLCSYSEVRAGSGDSGGPLVSKNRLIGVTSASCNDAEVNKNCVTIYVDVAQNLWWIQKNME